MDQMKFLMLSVGTAYRVRFPWSRGWESNPLQPSIAGCLLRVATRFSAARRLSRSAFGGQNQPRHRASGNLDRAYRNRISLLKIGAFLRNASSCTGYDLDLEVGASSTQSISFHTSLATRLASSSVATFPINNLPVLKTDTLCCCLVYTKTDSELATVDSFGILVLRDWRSTRVSPSGNTFATLSPHNITTSSK